jgi:hypothetical protein
MNNKTIKILKKEKKNKQIFNIPPVTRDNYTP